MDQKTQDKINELHAILDKEGHSLDSNRDKYRVTNNTLLNYIYNNTNNNGYRKQKKRVMEMKSH